MLEMQRYFKPSAVITLVIVPVIGGAFKTRLNVLDGSFTCSAKQLEAVDYSCKKLPLFSRLLNSGSDGRRPKCFLKKKKKPNAFVQSKTKPFHISAFFVKLHSIYSELYNFQLVGIK